MSRGEGFIDVLKPRVVDYLALPFRKTLDLRPSLLGNGRPPPSGLRPSRGSKRFQDPHMRTDENAHTPPAATLLFPEAFLHPTSGPAILSALPLDERSSLSVATGRSALAKALDTASKKALTGRAWLPSLCCASLAPRFFCGEGSPSPSTARRRLSSRVLNEATSSCTSTSAASRTGVPNRRSNPCRRSAARSSSRTAFTPSSHGEQGAWATSCSTASASSSPSRTEGCSSPASRSTTYSRRRSNASSPSRRRGFCQDRAAFSKRERTRSTRTKRPEILQLWERSSSTGSRGHISPKPADETTPSSRNGCACRRSTTTRFRSGLRSAYLRERPNSNAVFGRRVSSRPSHGTPPRDAPSDEADRLVVLPCDERMGERELARLADVCAKWRS